MNMYILGIILLLSGVVIGAWWTSSTSEETVPGEESVLPVETEVAEVEVGSESEQEQKPTFPIFGGSIEVYKDISVAKNTQVLDLSGRGLDGSLKAEVRQLTELRELDISDNNFTGLPAEVGQLTKLEKLDLSNNPFTGLPYELGNLKNLEVLDLRGTQYAAQDLEVIQRSLPANTVVLTD